MHAYGVTRQMPLWRDSQQLLLLVEQAVRDFPRYHKYTVGSELRRQAMRICRLLARACHDKEQRLAYVIQLNEAIDDLKIQLQLAKALAAFRHFKAFETIARLALPFTHKSPWSKSLGGQPLGVLRRQWRALVKERNNADGCPAACPSGKPRMRHGSVAALGKGRPFPARRALPWRIRGFLQGTTYG